MSASTAVKELPETSIWHGAVSAEDVQLVRRRHQEKVEEWLDEACFVTELNALHEKYGIEQGEEGFVAYRRHLRTNYYQKLYTYGPTPDPLDEGCDCIFCNLHSPETEQPVEESSVEETSVEKSSSEEQREEIPTAAPTNSAPAADKRIPTQQPPQPTPANLVARRDKKNPTEESAPTNRKPSPPAAPEKPSPPPMPERTARPESVAGIDPVDAKKIKPPPHNIIPTYRFEPPPPAWPNAFPPRRGRT